MVKRTTLWRQRRLRRQAIEFGFKLSEQMKRYSDNYRFELSMSSDLLLTSESSPSLMHLSEDDPLNETQYFENRMVSTVDVACALVLFKRRFQLSISCMNQLLELLPHIPRDNIPTNWFSVKKLLQSDASVLSPTITFICPSCCESLSGTLACLKCGKAFQSSSGLKSFKNFSVTEQLHRIITTNYSKMNLGKKSDGEKLRDICDGEVHRRLQNSSSDLFVTLTLNVDGIQPNKGSNKTIWPILLVINELPPKSRFSLENVILAGVWPGPKKPSRGDMSLFLKPLIDELVNLERGEGFFIPSNSANSFNGLTMIRSYLIGACCDKPAQALVQNIPEPIAAFGCGHCELEGEMVYIEATHGHVRSFAAEFNVLNETIQRCNTRYDTLLVLKEFRDSQRMQLPNKQQKKQDDIDRKKNCGILGPCMLRSCAMFDVGGSFMSDSLHNVYIGAFKRLLPLWLSSEHQSSPWNICNRINELGELFKRVRMPSTTARLPRTLIEYPKYKANELRALLLFGHVIFSNILSKKYYHHLLQLVCILHLAENRCISASEIKIIKKLSEEFVVSFSHLYTKRHCVQVVHSVVHIADTVQNFGPLTSYTTFHFEDQLGLLTRTCKSTRRHAEEMISNLQILQYAHQHLNKSTLSYVFKQQLLLLLPGKKKIYNNAIEAREQNNKVNSFAMILFPCNVLKFFNKLRIGTLELCTYTSAISKHGDDSTIIFRTSENSLLMGRIQSIFCIVETNVLFLVIEYPTVADYFTCPFENNNKFTYSSIQISNKKNFSNRLIMPTDVIEKCVYFEHPNGFCQFMRFPNLEHSS